MNRLIVCVGVLIAAAACGSDSPTSPSPPPEVIANFSGNWSGTYSVTGCTQTGGVALANICGLLGQTPPYGMSLSQTGRNAVGTFRLGSIEFPSTGGSVGTDGSLQLNGTSQSGTGVTIIVSWNLRMTGPQMSGTISQNWASSTLSGGATVTGAISTATRGLTAPTARVDMTRATLADLAAGASR